MAGSIMRAVKSAVLDGLSAAYAADDSFNGTNDAAERVEVSYGYDFASQAAERVFAGRGRVVSPPSALRAGRNFRDETGTFDLMVIVSRVGGSAEDADDRAYTVGGLAEDWIADRKNNELAVTGLQWIRVIGYDQTPLGNDRGALCEISYHVEYRGRIE